MTEEINQEEKIAHVGNCSSYLTFNIYCYSIILYFIRYHGLILHVASLHFNVVRRFVVRLQFVDKFALLWGEAQLCLPYVCL